ncbi:M1 family metallopeptidase [Flaviaesturariibacter terrae]
MKRTLSALLLLSALSARSQQASWQQRVDYRIDVTLDAAGKSLDGFERLNYSNNSPDTLRYIWFHLWPNAYKNDRSAFTDQQLRNGDTRFYFSDKEERGYINRLDFRVNGQPARSEDHPQWIDVVKLLLPAPLAPGDSAQITTPFHVKLPFNFSRGGYSKTGFQVTQWYPKPAVYDAKGWHPMPYLDQGEFYSEFGSYDVQINSPAGYKIAATGLQLPANTQLPLEEASSSSRTDKSRNFSHFRQDNVHDFAWFADSTFIVDRDTCRLPSGRVLEVKTYYSAAEKKWWARSLEYAKAALRFYSTEVGDYPYDVCSVVQGPEAFGGGMEYPTITVIEPIRDSSLLNITIAHEIGHNWFYGMLANNERDNPWMDEGFNTFYEYKYASLRHQRNSVTEDILFRTLARQKRDQPIATPADSMTEDNYALVTYHKTARWLQGIEQQIGADSMRLLMQDWFARNRFRHVQPEDFARHLRAWLPADAEAFEAQLQRSGPLPIQQASGTNFINILQPGSFRRYFTQPTKNAWLATVAAGINHYDRFMIGGLLTNYLLPPPKLRVLLLPLYATGTKQWNVLGRLSFTHYPDRGPKRLELFTAASTFSYNEFTDDKGRRFTARFFKVVPGAELELRNRDLRSTLRRTFQFKSFFLGEQPFRISYDSLINGTDTSVELTTRKQDLRYSIQQLTFRIDNNRALYPYSGALWVQFSSFFTRLHLEGNYFFNYPKGGGLALRLFGGKLLYDRNRTTYPYGIFPNRYFLSMSGVGGEQDYTYSHYFVARSAFEGTSSQQIAIRDGGFKVRTPLLSSPVGESDDWLAALNFNSSIPDAVNPLRVLPVKIPLHLFFDVGTYAGAWKPGAASGRFLFEAGLHVPLLNNLVNFYFPVVYSSAFGDYAKSIYPKNRFFKTMTFSIDLQNASGLIKKQRLF